MFSILSPLYPIDVNPQSIDCGQSGILQNDGRITADLGELEQYETERIREVIDVFDNLHRFADKLSYFFIAFAIYLIIRAIAICMTAPLVIVLLYLSIAVSLLASNIPQVIDIPLHYAYPVRCVEYFTFAVAVICFIVVCMHQLLI